VMARLDARILVYAPEHPGGAQLVAAAIRAGALGFLDFGSLGDPRAALVEARRVAGAVDRPFGARVAGSVVEGGWLGEAPGSLGFVALVEGSGIDWARAVATVERSGRVAWAEVASRRSAFEAVEAGARGLILAGHEAGGLASEDSSFIFLQAMAGRVDAPIWVRGGIGPHAAAGCLAAGAHGVVLDGALLLARESPLPEAIRERIGRWDGGETQVFGPADGPRRRLHAPPGSAALARLRAAGTADGESWEAEAGQTIGWGVDRAWPVGQDAAFAGPLARRHVTAGGIIQAVEATIERALADARATRPLAAGSPLARSHGTRFPILQGPMTRVSDVVPFARAVAAEGALPFLALAMLRGAEVSALLEEASRTLTGRPWGVGLLGFVSPELRAEQVAAVLRAKPPFALIAGGRPDQAAELERSGIAAYLHVPSPGLLAQFLKEGSRRFVLEGRECGGHVGPRSSLVLWEQAIELCLAAIDGGGAVAGDLHVVFAGGVHDGRSAALVSAMAGPLAARGAKVGVLVGTAYLFTAEAVATGAIVPRYQDEAIRMERTTLLETGPGHEVRVGPTPFVASFEAERRRLAGSGIGHEASREALERLNAGRLRLATKGFERADGADSTLIAAGEADQFERGIYMLGQVATLRDRVTTVAEIHRSIAEDGEALIEAFEPAPAAEPARPSDVAIVGMSAILPGAGDVRTFWRNTLRGFDAITEVPPDRWDWRLYYDANPKAPDKIVSKWGGFVPDVPFDPLRYGMPPTSLPSIEPVQLLLLEATRAAIDDAGYADRPFRRDRAAVVLGMGGGAAQLAMGYAFRSYLPMLDAVRPGSGRDALAACEGLLPEWTEDSFPGFLLNVAAGRVANRFDLGGANYTVDAACGSSLAAAALAVRELESGSADVVILGGADTVQNPFTYLAFSKTQAFSPRGRCRPFDASADGIAISEGVAVVVLKRLADAERDGDRIYAVIKGLGASSDGRAKGLTAPSPSGQVRAVERAYAKAGVEPSSVGYVEAHGTGTAVGDVVEVNAISEVFRARGVEPGLVVIGSVKSMIGHTKCAAGLAGLINASLALHHRVLPPTIGIEAPNPKADLADGPFRLNAEARPWLQGDGDRPRRAGVSAFGFGGTNFHAVLEAYDRQGPPATAPVRDWPAELFAWRAEDRASLLAALDPLVEAIERGARPPLADLARAVNGANPPRPSASPTLALVARSVEDLAAKIRSARSAIGSGTPAIDDPNGTWYRESPPRHGEKVAFLFPGQGSQYPGMLAELAVAFPEVRDGFDTFDQALARTGRPRVGSRIFPAPSFGEADAERSRQALRATEVAQPALGAASVGLLGLLGKLGVEADLLGGHSYGELVALHAAGSLSLEGLAGLSDERGRLMQGAMGGRPGAMAAVAAGFAEVSGRIAGIEGVSAVNENGPAQTVIAGRPEGVAEALARLGREGVRARLLPISGAFHTATMGGASRPLELAAAAALAKPADRPVYSNLDAGPHPSDPAEVAARLGRHLASPVRFGAMVRAMHEAGARVFVEVGPGSVLAPLVGSTLGDRPHLAVSCDAPGRPGIAALLGGLGRLVAAGVAARLERLAEGRTGRPIDLARLPAGDGSPALSATTWMVNGSRARPIDQPEPRRLGQAGLRPVEAVPRPIATPVPPVPRDGSANGHHDGHQNGKAMTQASKFPPAPVPAPLATSPADERVMAAFQETMRTFLDVQRSTMLAYLGGRSPADARPQGPPLPTGIPDPISDRLNGTPRPAPASAPTPAAGPRIDPKPIARPVEAGPAPAPAVAPAAMGREAVAARLVEIVRDRTGYPAEMLGLDLDLEADLGIDSIKRVEILGTLRDSVPALNGSSDTSTMDALSRARTLGAIVDRVEEIGRRSAPKSAEKPPPQAIPKPEPAATATPAAAVRRLVLEAVPAPLAKARSGLEAGGVVVVTDDGRGVARAVAAELRAAGHPVLLAGPGKIDFASPSSVELLLESARSSGRLVGVVHALPLRPGADIGLDPAAWSARLGPELRGLFHLAKASAADLDRASRRGGGALVAATAMGGACGSVGRGPDFFPGHGGISGLVKTLAREWPGVRARVVDFDPAAEARIIAARLAAEVLTDDGWSEVGYLGDRRTRLRAVEAPLGSDSLAAAGVAMAPGEPLIVTGGARGITAALTAELARAWRPTLLLLGRSPLPAGAEDRETAGIDSASELKAVLHARLREAGEPATPATLDRAYQAVRHAREIRANLEAYRATGATVDYAPVDVRDGRALAQVLDRWRRRHGEPAGLIHGAGVIKDKLLRDKTAEAFDFVLGTKIDGALNLARLLKGDTLRFAALFSSIAGRFGNLGQSDYAAANEVLNKLALWLDRRWPGRVVSMIWGPWSGVGMVSDLEGHLGGRGLGMIPPEVGRSLLLDELRAGRKGEVEVIQAGELGSLDGPIEPARPLLAGAAR